LKFRNFPVNLAPKNAVGELGKIEGKKLNKHLEAGYPLTEKDLLTKEQQEYRRSIVTLVSEQRRSKLMLQSPAGGFVLPGSRVDIIQTGRNNGKAYSRIIRQHILGDGRGVTKTPVIRPRRAIHW
jgi:Flp pilus assembly protein CpaB